MHFDDMLKVGAAAIVRHDPDLGWSLLSARRTEPPVAAGLWEFPGGKVDPGETVEGCVIREIKEELGVDVTLIERIVGPMHGYWQLGERIAIALWLCSIPAEQEPVMLEDHDAIAWLNVETLYSVPWIPADEIIVREIEVALRNANRTGSIPSLQVQGDSN